MCASVLRFSFVLLADSFGCLLACFYLFILSCSALICCALVRSAAQGRQGKASHVLFIPSKKKKENHPKKKKKKKQVKNSRYLFPSLPVVPKDITALIHL